jgi:ribosome-associated protein
MQTESGKDQAKFAGTAAASAAFEPETMEDVLALVVNAARDKFAEDIRVIDVMDCVDYVDYVVVCNGQTAIQNRAIIDRIIEVLKQYDIILSSLQGYRLADWILIDYDTFVVHVFLPEAREFYHLEDIYSGGNDVELPNYAGL